MRVSADPASQYYNPWNLVYLQGKLLTCVLYADDAKGKVIVAKQDDQGRILHDGENVVKEVFRGHVKIDPADAAHYI